MQEGDEKHQRDNAQTEVLKKMRCLRNDTADDAVP